MSVTTERKHRDFWVIEEFGTPTLSTGFECPGTDYWWFPKLGFSTSKVFDTADDARAEAIQASRACIEVERKILAKLGATS